MANQFNVGQIYANVGLKLLKNHLVIGRKVNTEMSDTFAKVGDTIYAKRPPRYVAKSGSVLQKQDIKQGQVPVVMDRRFHVGYEVTSDDATLKVDQLLRDQNLDAAMAALAQQVDTDLHALAHKFPNWVGTPGQVVDSFSDFTKAPQRLDEMAVPMANRVGFMPPSDAWPLIASLSNSPSIDTVAKDALIRARIPVLGNIELYQAQSQASITTGTRTGGNVDGANQNVDYATDAVRNGSWTQSLICEALGNAKTVKAGEIFTIDGVYAINPADKQAYTYLQQFTVTADATANSTAGGQATLTISPPIITEGAYQTVSAAPADDAAITWFGDATATNTDSTVYRPSFACHRDALALVYAKLEKPESGTWGYATDPDSGVTVRFWRSSDFVNDTHGSRFDILYGVKNVDPMLGTRFSGTA